MKIPFNIPYLSGKEETYMLESVRSRAHCGNHSFSQKCLDHLRKVYGFEDVFLNPSCTAALEMGVMLAEVGADDEVIVPSYTFSSTANAIMRVGARPVFCEIEPDTMNIDVTKIEALITAKTKMIIPIDYAGIPCDIDAIMEIAHRHNLVVMVDAAQSFHSFYKGKPAASIPDLAAFSFHETKNSTCGEGGALVVNRKDWVERAHFLQEKGTDRKLVLDGVRNKYQWVAVGSSFLLADILAAMLLAQLEATETIVSERAKVSAAYQELFDPYARAGNVRIPRVSTNGVVNHHAFFVIFDSKENRQRFLAELREKQVYAYIGYVPLHSSSMGQSLGYKAEDLPLTEDIGNRIVRLPLYADLAQNGLDYCITSMRAVLSTLYG